MERAIVSGIFALALCGVAATLAVKAQNRTRTLEQLYERIAFSTSSHFGQAGKPGLVFDGRPTTAWTDRAATLAGNRYRLPAQLERSIPDPQSMHLTMEVGLSHYPGLPPLTNPIRAVQIWSGDQKTPAAFRASRRPRTVHLIFFKQKLVDTDRDYRLPGQPIFWRRLRLQLADRMGMQRIDLQSVLPELPASSGFPHNIYMIWLRIVVEDFYPARNDSPRTELAISEILFEKLHGRAKQKQSGGRSYRKERSGRRTP